MRGRRRRMIELAWTILVCAIPGAALAYHSKDVERVAAPPGVGLKLLRGYNSRTGQLTDHCVSSSSSKRERGAGQPGVREFKLIHSVHEILTERDLSIAAELSVGFGIGGASLSVEQSFFKKSSSSVENGAAYAYFLDYSAPVFADSAAKYQLTDDAAALFQRTARDQSKHFERSCGDAVVIGFQSARSFQGIATLAKSATSSEEARETNVKLAARYMIATLNGTVQQMGKERTAAESLEIKVHYIASGDAELHGATNLEQFARAYRQFEAANVAQTTDVVYIYVIPYSKLLDRSEFDLGIPKQRMQRVRTIINGIQRIELARAAARSEAAEATSEGARERARTAQRFLTRELKILKEAFRRADGCIDEFSSDCENLYARLDRGPNVRNRAQLKEFAKTAIASAKECRTGYPVTRPNGLAVCAQCDAGKEPVFTNGNDGACRYLARAPKAPGVTRLFMGDLKQSRRTQLEAGVVGTIAIYPNFEARNCDKDCRSKAADAVCKSHSRGVSTGFEVWNPLVDDLAEQPRHFFYPNGDMCRPSGPGAFEAVRCKTFKYVDCAGVRTGG